MEDSPSKTDKEDKKGSHLDSVLTAISAIITAIAWPLFAIWTVSFIAHHHQDILNDIGVLRGYIKTADLQAGPFQIKAEMTDAVATALATSPSPASASSVGSHASAPEATLAPISPDEAKRLAANAVSKLDVAGGSLVSKTVRVLWVDPHPGNNVNLQYAFQRLGIVVVTVQDDTAVRQAFNVAKSFDVCITNMVRDGVPNAGLATNQLVKRIQPNIPVIVYSATWAAIHGGQEAYYGLKLISNRTDDVFQAVVAIAQSVVRPTAVQ